MGPDFLDRQSLWRMFCCNFICLLFLIENIFFQPDIRRTKPDIRPDTGYNKRPNIRPDIRCNARKFYRDFVMLVYISKALTVCTLHALLTIYMQLSVKYDKVLKNIVTFQTCRTIQRMVGREVMISTLGEMGFSENRAKHALRATDYKVSYTNLS